VVAIQGGEGGVGGGLAESGEEAGELGAGDGAVVVVVGCGELGGADAAEAGGPAARATMAVVNSAGPTRAAPVASRTISNVDR